MRWPAVSTEERFMGHVSPEPNSGCWLWTASVNAGGYGWFIALDIGERLAHRVSYALARGAIPAGLQLDHLCRVRSCVNPQHLEVVTGKENIMRGIGVSARNAKKTRCPSGHEYTGSNNVVREGPHGPIRCCRECNRLRAARNRAKVAADQAAGPSGNLQVNETVPNVPRGLQ